MTDAKDIAQKIQDQTMEAVRKGQDATLEAATAWTESANKVAAQLPDFAKNFELLGFEGVAKQLPTMGEVIDSNFDFAHRLLTIQRDFAHRVIAASTSAAE